MAKVLMSSVYARIKERQLVNLANAKAEAQKDDKNNYGRISYPFVAFQQDLRQGDMLTSVPTIKNKWDNMIADGVIIEIPGGKRYGRALLDIRGLELAGHLFIIPTAVRRQSSVSHMQEVSE